MSSPSLPDPLALPAASIAIHLDLVGGIAGDMFVAAMLDAIPSLAAPVLAALAQVQPAGASVPALTATSQGGLRAARFGLDAGSRAPRNLAIAAPAADGTSYPALRGIVERAPLDEGTRHEALALLAALAEAEAGVHGIAIEHVHFHELADWDSLLDIVAAGAIAARLRGAQWSASPPPLGGGTVRTAHGVLPVPAPATTRLLLGVPCRDDGIRGERVTPTGAAILRHLVPLANFEGRHAAGRLLATGLGAGTQAARRRPQRHPRAGVRDDGGAEGDTVATIDFDIDDMTGEEIAFAADRLRATAGVIDVSVGTRAGKKGRTLSDFRLLVAPPAVEDVVRACFAQTSTLGVRVGEVRRHVLRRAEVEAAIEGATVGVKLAQRPDGARTAKAEHDEVAEATSLARRRAVRARAERAALEGDE